jgi:hypothetical protein
LKTKMHFVINLHTLRQRAIFVSFDLLQQLEFLKKSPSRKIIFLMPQKFSLYALLFRTIFFSLCLIAKWSFVLESHSSFGRFGHLWKNVFLLLLRMGK